MFKHKDYVLIAIWFLGCSALIVWLGLSNKNQFDPKLVLSSAIMDLRFEHNVTQILTSAFPHTIDKARLFHITQGNCYCEWLAEPHQQKLTTWARQNQMLSIALNINDHPRLKEFVPSTPAVIAIDENGHLFYLGPYSRGSGCFGKNGEIDQQLKKWAVINTSTNVVSSVESTNIADINYNLGTLQSIIDTDASGCYCGV